MCVRVCERLRLYCVSKKKNFFGYASFIAFCIAHILDGKLGERVMIDVDAH